GFEAHAPNVHHPVTPQRTVALRHEQRTVRVSARWREPSDSVNAVEQEWGDPGHDEERAFCRLADELVSGVTSFLGHQAGEVDQVDKLADSIVRNRSRPVGLELA